MAFKIPFAGTESLAEGCYEAVRQLRTNSLNTTFEKRVVKFKHRLRTRGDPKTIIERSLSGLNLPLDH